jgi:hypothetical protein
MERRIGFIEEGPSAVDTDVELHNPRRQGSKHTR